MLSRIQNMTEVFFCMRSLPRPAAPVVVVVIIGLFILLVNVVPRSR
jgi:hypothetical protein